MGKRLDTCLISAGVRPELIDHISKERDLYAKEIPQAEAKIEAVKDAIESVEDSINEILSQTDTSNSQQQITDLFTTNREINLGLNTVDDVLTALQSQVGNAVNNMIEDGSLSIVQNVEEAVGEPLYVEDQEAVVGFYEDGKITIIASNVIPGAETNVFRHELLHKVLAEDELLQLHYSTIMGKFFKLKGKSASVERAFNLVPEGTAAEDIVEEAFAYFIQDNRNLQSTIFKEVVAAIKVWMFKKGIPVNLYTEADFVALAQKSIQSGMMKKNLKGSTARRKFMMAGRKSKTFLMNKKEQAKQMIKDGSTPEEAWRETGFVEVHGFWKYEINDQNSSLVRGIEETKKEVLQDFPLYIILKHPELYTAYPALQDVKVKFEDLGEDYGVYYPSKNLIIVNNTLSNDFIHSVLLHEVQHKIQSIEGWPKGRSLEYQADPNEDLWDIVKDSYYSVQETERYILGGEIYLEILEWYGPGSKEVARAQDIIGKERRTNPKYNKDADIFYSTGEYFYWRSAGEVEARNTQTRFLAELTDTIFPISSMEFPLSEQFVEFNKEGDVVQKSVSDEDLASLDAIYRKDKQKGINISSYESGLGGRLTNFHKEPMTFRGKKYASSEEAYQKNKTKDLSDEAVSTLMDEVLIARLEQQPDLVKEIDDAGGIEFLNKSTHTLLKNGKEIKKNDRWVTSGKDLFMKSLKKAYLKVSPKEVTTKPKENTYVNHSGGALGSDSAWDAEGQKYGVSTNAYYSGKKTPNGNLEISEEAFQEGIVKAKQAAQLLKRNWSNKDFIQRLLSRNWQQVKNADAVFAIGTIEGKYAAGGTGYAIAMAEVANKPTYLFDQNKNSWFKKEEGTWVKVDTPRLTSNFAGIGTRDLKDNGRQAIADVYEKTFSAKNIDTGLKPSLEKEQKHFQFFDYNVIFHSNIKSKREGMKEGLLGATKGNTIFLSSDFALWKKKYQEQAWTKPYELADGTFANALPENKFRSIDEFQNFVLLHEIAHLTRKKKDSETMGEYETAINNLALEQLAKEKVTKVHTDLKGRPQDTIYTLSYMKRMVDRLIPFKTEAEQLRLIYENSKEERSRQVEDWRNENSDDGTWIKNRKISYYVSNETFSGTIDEELLKTLTRVTGRQKKTGPSVPSELSYDSGSQYRSVRSLSESIKEHGELMSLLNGLGGENLNIEDEINALEKRIIKANKAVLNKLYEDLGNIESNIKTDMEYKDSQTFEKAISGDLRSIRDYIIYSFQQATHDNEFYVSDILDIISQSGTDIRTLTDVPFEIDEFNNFVAENDAIGEATTQMDAFAALLGGGIAEEGLLMQDEDYFQGLDLEPTELIKEMLIDIKKQVGDLTEGEYEALLNIVKRPKEFVKIANRINNSALNEKSSTKRTKKAWHKEVDYWREEPSMSDGLSQPDIRETLGLEDVIQQISKKHNVSVEEIERYNSEEISLNIEEFYLQNKLQEISNNRDISPSFVVVLIGQIKKLRTSIVTLKATEDIFNETYQTEKTVDKLVDKISRPMTEEERLMIEADFTQLLGTENEIGIFNDKELKTFLESIPKDSESRAGHVLAMRYALAKNNVKANQIGLENMRAIISAIKWAGIEAKKTQKKGKHTTKITAEEVLSTLATDKHTTKEMKALLINKDESIALVRRAIRAFNFVDKFITEDAQDQFEADLLAESIDAMSETGGVDGITALDEIEKSIPKDKVVGFKENAATGTMINDSTAVINMYTYEHANNILSIVQKTLHSNGILEQLASSKRIDAEALDVFLRKSNETNPITEAERVEAYLKKLNFLFKAAYGENSEQLASQRVIFKEDGIEKVKIDPNHEFKVDQWYGKLRRSIESIEERKFTDQEFKYELQKKLGFMVMDMKAAHAQKMFESIVLVEDDVFEKAAEKFKDLGYSPMQLFGLFEDAGHDMNKLRARLRNEQLQTVGLKSSKAEKGDVSISDFFSLTDKKVAGRPVVSIKNKGVENDINGLFKSSHGVEFVADSSMGNHSIQIVDGKTKALVNILADQDPDVVNAALEANVMDELFDVRPKQLANVVEALRSESNDNQILAQVMNKILSGPEFGTIQNSDLYLISRVLVESRNMEGLAKKIMKVDGGKEVFTGYFNAITTTATRVQNTIEFGQITKSKIGKILIGDTRNDGMYVELVRSMLGDESASIAAKKVNGSSNRMYAKITQEMAEEMYGLAKDPAFKFKSFWGEIFGGGVKNHRDVMTAVERLLGKFIGLVKKLHVRVWYADFLANKEATEVGNLVMHGYNMRVSQVDKYIKKNFKDAFTHLSENVLMLLHDRVVRGVIRVPVRNDAGTIMKKEDGSIIYEDKPVKPLNFTTDKDIKIAKDELGMSDQMIEAFKYYKNITDEIFGELKEFYPELEYRYTHYGQSLQWMDKKENDINNPKNSLESVISREGYKEEQKLKAARSIKGSEHFTSGKNTSESSFSIMEKTGNKPKTFDPNMLMLNYVRETGKQLVAHRAMELAAANGEGKIFRSEGQATAQGFHKVDDSIFNIYAGQGGIKVLVNGEPVQTFKGKDAEGNPETVIRTYNSIKEAKDSIDGLTLQGGIYFTENGDVVEFIKDQTEEQSAFIGYEIYKDGEATGTYLPTKKSVDQWIENHAVEESEYTSLPKYGGAVEKGIAAKMYFSSDLAAMLNNVVGKDHFRSTKLRKKVLTWKNGFTQLEFFLSFFHAVVISMEATISQMSYEQLRQEGFVNKMKKGNPFTAFRTSLQEGKEISALVDAVLANPNLVDRPEVQDLAKRLFGSDSVDLMKGISAFYSVGGLRGQDNSVRSNAHSFGEMRYSPNEPTLVIENGKASIKLPFAEVSLIQVPIIAARSVKGSVKEAFANAKARNPDAPIKNFLSAAQFATAESGSAWLMENFVPNLKIAAFMKEYYMRLEREHDQIQNNHTSENMVAHNTMKFVEDRFGEVNWDNQWMQPTLRSALVFSFRSFTWFTGSIKAFTKAGVDIGKWGWFKAKDVGAKDKVNYEMTEKGLWAINAFIAHMVVRAAMQVIYESDRLYNGGDEEKDEDIDLFSKMMFFRLDPADTKAVYAVPSYWTEFYKLLHHLQIVGDKFEPWRFVAGRFNTVIGNTMEVWEGKDWRGVQVRDSSDSIPEQAFDSVVHAFKVAPFSFSSSYKEWKKKGFSTRMLYPILGVLPAPAEARQSPAVTRAYQLRRDSFTLTRTGEEVSLSEEISKAAYQFGQGDTEPLIELYTSGRISKTKFENAIKRLKTVTDSQGNRIKNPLGKEQIVRAIANLTMDQTLEVWLHMSDAEKEMARETVLKRFYNVLNRDAKSPEDKKKMFDLVKEYRIFKSSNK